MSQFTDRMFSFKEGYSFGTIEEKPREQRLHQELGYQLQDLENHWMQLNLWKEERSLKQEIHYQCALERILFRLEEIDRFLLANEGPKIIQYVCSEVHDLLQEQQQIGRSLNLEIKDQVEVILAVINCYLNEEISEVLSITVDVVAQRLKEATEKLLQRFTGKRRNENLQYLLNLKAQGEDGGN